VNAALLDVLFTVLAVSGLVLAAVIAERERAEAERERLTAVSTLGRRMIEAQEQERRRIARELHDDIGQRLALLASNLTLLAKRAHLSDRPDPTASELQLRTSEIAADVQALSHRLHSSKLELLGLAVAMRHFCAEFADQQKAAVLFDTRDVPDRLSPDTSLCLFRILQEALHNAAKHSGGRRFDVQVFGDDGQVHLVVSDDGKGFDVGTGRMGRGIGLISMEERIKLVHGALSIESQPGHGTTIHARVPITPS
jgi:signal transduction histidine kinase